MRFVLFWLPYSYPCRSRYGILYEHRYSQLRDFCWKSCAFCWYARALRACTSLSSTAPVRVDDAQRRAAPRAVSDEQSPRVMLRQLIHRQRSAVGMATESRWRVKPGTVQLPFFFREALPRRPFRSLHRFSDETCAFFFSSIGMA